MQVNIDTRRAMRLSDVAPGGTLFLSKDDQRRYIKIDPRADYLDLDCGKEALLDPDGHIASLASNTEVFVVVVESVGGRPMAPAPIKETL